MKIIRSAWSFALLLTLASTGASANLITMNDYNGTGGVANCVEGCMGFVGTGPVSLSNTSAQDYPKEGSPASELIALNALLALFQPARAPVAFVNKTDGAGQGFSTNLQYFSIKQATEMFFFENTSGGTLNVSLVNTANYSHWTEYGPAVSEVPVPAAFWLFGTALVGFIGVSRRRNIA